MSNVVIKVGGTAQAVATATPVDPTVTLPAATYTWSSSDDSKATVDANGKITAVSANSDGTNASVLITATTTIDGVTASGAAGLDVALPGNPFSVTVVITPNP